MNGIYRITNLPTGRFYIGSAVNVERRWKRHVYDFKAQRHHNSKLQRALKQSKTYIVTFPDGTEITVTNLKQFCRENDLSQAHMSSVATGKRKHHKGYKARETDPVYNAR